MAVEDVYLLALHEAYESVEHPVPINASIVHARTPLNAEVLQPDGGFIYRCLTEFPSRTPGCVVPLSTLTFELKGGELWPEVADWHEVAESVVRLARRRGCDAMSLGLTQTQSPSLANGPNTSVHFYVVEGQVPAWSFGASTAPPPPAGQVREVAAEQPFWPGDRLVAPPRRPRRMPSAPLSGR